MQTANINLVIDALLKLDIDLAHMQVQTPNLETVFLNLTGRRLRD
jgi:ABC-2 type transport system ATP-binding protein